MQNREGMCACFQEKYFNGENSQSLVTLTFRRHNRRVRNSVQKLTLKGTTYINVVGQSLKVNVMSWIANNFVSLVVSLFMVSHCTISVQNDSLL